MLSHSRLRRVEMLQQAVSAERVALANMPVFPPCSDDIDMREWYLPAWQYRAKQLINLIDHRE